jgi:LysR family glycine cleavage system transcriptional activator
MTPADLPASRPPDHATSTRLPPLIALSYFEVAARTGSFSEAAKLLHVSPAAVSHQVKALESILGIQLFVRHNRKVVLTRAAELALPRLQEGFAALADAVEQLRAHRDDESIITVCAEPLLATKWLVPRLHRFYAAFPDAEVRLQASLGSVDSVVGGPVPLASFQRSGIDVSLRLGFGIHPDLHVSPMFPLVLVPMCAPALLPRLSVPADVLRVPLLCDSTHLRSPARFGWAEWLDQQGIARPTTLREQRFGNGPLALEAAVSGHGVWLASPELTVAEREAGKLCIAFPQAEALALRTPLAYHLTCPPAALERPIVRAFQDWLQLETTSARAASLPPAP